MTDNKEYSTSEAAAMIGVARVTLLGWLRSGRLKEPNTKRRAGHDRIWTDEDIERGLALKAKLRRGRPRESSKYGDKELLDSGRLLQFNQLLGWYAANFELKDSSLDSAVRDLQSDVSNRLLDRKW
jgi:transposase